MFTTGKQIHFGIDFTAENNDTNYQSGTQAFYFGLNAVIWGYPAVKFEQLMRGRTKPDIVKMGNPQAVVNQFGLVRELRGPEFKHRQ